MDPTEEFELTIREMKWEDVLDTFQAVVEEILGDEPNPPTPPTPPHQPPSVVPAEQGFDIHSQPVEIMSGGSGGCIHQGADQHSFDQPLMHAPGLNVGQAAPMVYQEPLYDPNVMQSGHLHSQAGAYSQGQYLPYQWPVYNVPGAAVASAPPHHCNNVQVVTLPQGIEGNLVPIGTMNGEVVYGIPTDVFAPCASASAAPPLNTHMSQKRWRESQEQEDEPYIKKPPNAFMLFRKEQRPNVVAELNIRDSAAVNAILGQRWKSLSMEEQARYFEEADRERRLHAQRFPDWSSRDNYGKKRKRIRSKVPKRAKASASNPEQIAQQAKRPRLTPIQTGPSTL